MQLRDIIRVAALRANTWRSFRKLNEKPYELAIRRFVRLCRKYPAIKSVYLRHALDDGQWTPALSDIDFTVVIRSDLSRDEEFSFLRSFWKRTRSLLAFFPMVGEIEILNETHLASWTKFGIEGRMAASWQLLAGIETVVKGYRPDPARFALEAFDYTFWFYLRNFSGIFMKSRSPRYLVSQDLARLQRKIDRCLQHIDPEHSAQHTLESKSQNDADTLFAIQEKLDQVLPRVLPLQRPGKSIAKRQKWLLTQVVRRNPKPDEDDNADALQRWRAVIRSIYIDEQEQAFVIFKEDADLQAKKQCVHDVRQFFASKHILPVVLTAALFEYMLRHLCPYKYHYFLKERKLFFGEDMVTGLAPPGKIALAHDLLKQAPLLLTFPQQRNFILPEASDSFRQPEFKFRLERCLALKHYLEQGVIKRRFHDMVADFYAHYPDHADRLYKLTAKQPEWAPENLAFEWFNLLREVTDDIHQALTIESWEYMYGLQNSKKQTASEEQKAATTES